MNTNDDDDDDGSNKESITAHRPPYLPLVSPWIRGVNLGGWLMLERYITPYQFAVTDCHLAGDFCWYPGQASAPPKHSATYKLCDLYRCRPALTTPTAFDDDETADYPLDEYTLAKAFAHNKPIGESWLNHHFANFITEHDIRKLAAVSGLTHVRVPLPHWILGDVESSEEEPWWLVGDRWEHFVQLCEWCRQYGLQVWPDIHTAPGSQNGFDNSGHALTAISCRGWSNNATNVERSLAVIRNVTAAIVAEGIDDVVTGFGLLNEPFKDCDRGVYERFINDGRNIVHATLGQDTAVYVSDMFLAKTFNRRHWWLDANNTFLDSHYYHVFAEEPRALSPRQHIAYVCQNEYRDVTACCYQDAPRNQIASSRTGVKRLVGEWSAAYDTLPAAMLRTIMDGIAVNGTAPYLDRQMSRHRQKFLKHFMQAQMVAYEAVGKGVSGGWFYWTAKMEGGAFAEWDFLRGLREGWIPDLVAPNATSESAYGTCYDIIFRTNDSMHIIHEFPDPSQLPDNAWPDPIDDDVVVTHGDSLLHRTHPSIFPEHHRGAAGWLLFGTIVLFLVVVWRLSSRNRRKYQYTQLTGSTDSLRISV